MFILETISPVPTTISILVIVASISRDPKHQDAFRSGEYGCVNFNLNVLDF